MTDTIDNNPSNSIIKQQFLQSQNGITPNNSENSKLTKKYSVIPKNIREKFIDRVMSREVTIKEVILNE